MEKKFIFIVVFTATNLLSSLWLNAQDNIGIGTNTPNPFSILDIDANDKGVLVPRLTTVQRTSLAPTMGQDETGLLVFDSDLIAFHFWDGNLWVPIANGIAGDNDWVVHGSTVYNDQAVVRVGIGTALPEATLHVRNSLSGGGGYANLAKHAHFSGFAPNISFEDISANTSFGSEVKAGSLTVPLCSPSSI